MRLQPKSDDTSASDSNRRDVHQVDLVLSTTRPDWTWLALMLKATLASRVAAGGRQASQRDSVADLQNASIALAQLELGARVRLNQLLDGVARVVRARQVDLAIVGRRSDPVDLAVGMHAAIGEAKDAVGCMVGAFDGGRKRRIRPDGRSRP